MLYLSSIIVYLTYTTIIEYSLTHAVRLARLTLQGMLLALVLRVVMLCLVRVGANVPASLH